MKNKLFKILLSFGLVVFGSLFFSAENVEAACVVNQARFRTTPSQIPPTGWYTDTNPPYVYIDFQTTGCIPPNNKFELSVTEYDVDEDINPVDLTGVGTFFDLEGFGPVASLDDDDISGFDNRIIEVPTGISSFTIAARAGDEECESVYQPNCRYYIRINDNVLHGVTQYFQTSRLEYNCHNGCDNKNWEFKGILQTYQGTHPDDIPSTGGGSGTETPNGPGVADQEIEITISNPIGANNMTLVDFIEKVIKFALTIGIPIIAIAIIYSGLLLVTARGNDQQLETAKNAFTYAVIGGALLLGSFIFAKLIKETIETIAMISIYFG